MGTLRQVGYFVQNYLFARNPQKARRRAASKGSNEPPLEVNNGGL